METTQQDVAHGSRLNAYTALILATLAMIVCFMSWSNFAPLAAQVGTMFHLSVASRTLLLATPVLLGSIARIPVGILSDKYGGKKVYIILMIFILIPAVHDSAGALLLGCSFLRPSSRDGRNFLCLGGFLRLSLVPQGTTGASTGDRFDGEHGERRGGPDPAVHFQVPRLYRRLQFFDDPDRCDRGDLRHLL